MIGKTIGYFAFRGFVFGCILGAIYGTILALIIGTIYGALIGAVLGLAVGAIGGLIIGGITRRWFFPPADPQQYRWTMRVMGGLLALSGTMIGLGLFFGVSVADWLSSDALGFVLVPAMIAGFCGVMVSDRYVDHFLANEEKIIGIYHPRRKSV